MRPPGALRPEHVCLACLVPLFCLLAGCAVAPRSAPLHRFEFSQPHMGTMFTLVLHAPDEPAARAAAGAAFRRVAELNRAFSDYDPESELNSLRAAPPGTPVPVSRDLFDVLSRAQHLARLTDGAFDVTVGPYVDLWRRARRQKALPDPDRLRQAGEAVGFRKLVLDPVNRRVTLTVPGMKLDLGGIAKGYAADAALAMLRRHGLPRALIAAGGDVVLGDPPPGLSGWRVGIASIDAAPGEFTRKLQLRNAAISTSGDTEQFVEIGGVRYSHIVDPRTGLGLTSRLGVTVVAPDATTSDSLATAVSVLGAEKGLALIESQPGVAALLVQVEADGPRHCESRRWRTLRGTTRLR